MDKDMLTTFDDDALDQVSGGVDPGLVRDAIITYIGQSIEDTKEALANRFARMGTLLTDLSTAFKS